MSKGTTTLKARLHPGSGPTAGRQKGKNSPSATNPSALRPAAGTRQETFTTKAKTLRLEPQYENALAFLKTVLGASVNKMVNDAVGQYIQRETARVEVNLGDLLAQVKAYRKADPDFSHAHARIVEAEVKAVGNDPADGTPYREAPATTRRRSHA